MFDLAIDFQIQKGSIMKRFIAIAAALAAIVICSEGNLQAQTRLHPGGFPYPGAFQQGFSGFGNLGFDREQPPYFAKFPPVYYSHAVKRPYGVSPYAAPAGVVPVELTHALPRANPVVIDNPHFEGKSSEGHMEDHNAKPKMKPDMKSDMKPETKANTKAQAKPKKNKVVGWQTNPYFEENRLVLN